MKKLILIVIFILTLGVCIFIPVKISNATDEIMTVMTYYDRLNENDLQFQDCSTQSPLLLHELISTYQQQITSLIDTGITYTDDVKVQSKFEELHQTEADLKNLTQQIQTCAYDPIENYPSLNDNQENLDQLFSDVITKRLSLNETYQNVLAAITTTLTATADFEKNFYLTSISEASDYFSDIYNDLNILSSTYNDYSSDVTDYYSVKEELYNSLTDTYTNITYKDILKHLKDSVNSDVQ